MAASSSVGSMPGCGFTKRGSLGLPISAVGGSHREWKPLVSHSAEAQARAQNPLLISLEDLPNYHDEVMPCFEKLYDRFAEDRNADYSSTRAMRAHSSGAPPVETIKPPRL